MFTPKKVADTYDQIALNFSATRPRLSAEAISLLPCVTPGAKILDLGCGNGVLLTTLPDNIDYLGLDFSPIMIKEATGSHPAERFELADITNGSTWEKLAKYDFIAALAVFHHLPTPADHIKLLQNIKQHLKPDGTALISVWDLNQPKFAKFAISPHHYSIPFHQGVSRDFYVFTDNELAKLIEQVGFSNIKTKVVKDNLYLNVQNHAG